MNEEMLILYLIIFLLGIAIDRIVIALAKKLRSTSNEKCITETSEGFPATNESRDDISKSLENHLN